MSKTHYETLEVSEWATQEEIKWAYRRLAKKHHPDRNNGADAKFKEINLAYQELGDPGNRQIYDYDLKQSRKAGASSARSAGSSSPPPPPPPPKQPGASAPQAPPAQAPASQAYRYLFFFRGAVVGGALVGAFLLFAIILYVSCRRSPAERTLTPPVPSWIPSNPTPATLPMTSTAVIETPTATPTDLPEPSVTPEPTVTPEPATEPRSTPTPEPERRFEGEAPAPTARPMKLAGSWRGSYGWNGRRVPFSMRLDERGSEIDGTFTEACPGALWCRTTVAAEVHESTASLVALVRMPDSRVRMMRFICLYASPDLLRGIVLTPHGREPWEAERAESEAWRLR